MKQFLYILSSASIPALILADSFASSGESVPWIRVLIIALLNAAITTKALYDRLGSASDRKEQK